MSLQYVKRFGQQWAPGAVKIILTFARIWSNILALCIFTTPYNDLFDSSLWSYNHKGSITTHSPAIYKVYMRDVLTHCIQNVWIYLIPLYLLQLYF